MLAAGLYSVSVRLFDATVFEHRVIPRIYSQQYP